MAGVLHQQDDSVKEFGEGGTKKAARIAPRRTKNENTLFTMHIILVFAHLYDHFFAEPPPLPDPVFVAIGRRFLYNADCCSNESHFSGSPVQRKRRQI
jgi:hypothetical protein